jgi:hypothetical protein
MRLMASISDQIPYKQMTDTFITLASRDIHPRYGAANVSSLHSLTTDRKILGSKYCAAGTGFWILVTRV